MKAPHIEDGDVLTWWWMDGRTDPPEVGQSVGRFIDAMDHVGTMPEAGAVAEVRRRAGMGEGNVWWTVRLPVWLVGFDHLSGIIEVVTLVEPDAHDRARGSWETWDEEELQRELAGWVPVQEDARALVRSEKGRGRC